MNIIVTGCNGFIGSNLVQFYTHKGYNVIGIDKSNNNSNGDYINCDLEKEELEDIFIKIKPDYLIHCAGSADVSLSIKYPSTDFNSNVKVLHKVLYSLKEVNKKCKIIFLSSAAVYGNPVKIPISEQAILNPISPYGLHKLMCEELCRYFIYKENMDISILRIFSAYGNGLKKQIFWDMYRKIQETNKLELYGNGNETRDFINIVDIINAIDLILFKNNKEDYLFNIASGKEVSMREIAEIFVSKLKLSKSIIKFNGTIKEGDPFRWAADISRLKKLGYKKSMELDLGIENYLEWVTGIKK